MQILAISGSLRAASTNTILLQATAALAPGEVTLRIHDGLGALPHFNPDLDKEPPHAAVAEFRFQLRKSTGFWNSTAASRPSPICRYAQAADVSGIEAVRHRHSAALAWHPSGRNKGYWISLGTKVSQRQGIVSECPVTRTQSDSR
jgi:hypothetical protein